MKIYKWILVYNRDYIHMELFANGLEVEKLSIIPVNKCKKSLQIAIGGFFNSMVFLPGSMNRNRPAGKLWLTVQSSEADLFSTVWLIMLYVLHV